MNDDQSKMDETMRKLREQLPEEEKAYKPITENPIKVDFRECNASFDIFQLIKARLGLPNFCGENWSAIWDLADGFSPHPVTIELYGVEAMESPRDVEIMFRVFDRIHKRTPHIEFVRVDSI